MDSNGNGMKQLNVTIETPQEQQSKTHSFTRYWIPKELTGDHHHTACYEQGDWPFVEQLEGEIINWYLKLEIFINNWQIFD